MRIQPPTSLSSNFRTAPVQNQRLAMLRASAASTAAPGGIIDAPPAQTAAGNAVGPIDINALMQAWGSANGQFDLDGNGTVDASDLTMALHENETAAAPPPDGTDPAGIMANWGTANQLYDLDGSGTVDAADLAIALNGPTNRSGAGAPADPRITSLVDRTFEARDTDGDGVLHIEDFGNQYRVFMQVDADADGSVTRDELQTVLQTAFETVQKNHPGANLDAYAMRWEHGLLDDHGAVPTQQSNFRSASLSALAKASFNPNLQPTYAHPSHATALLAQRGTLVNARA